MKHLFTYNLFERKSDENLIDNVLNIYNDIFELLKVKVKEKKYILSNNTEYFFLLDYKIPMVVAFDKSRKHASFGKIEVGGIFKSESLPTLFLKNEYSNEGDFGYLLSYSASGNDVKHEITHMVDVLKHGDFKSIPDNKTQIDWNDKDIKYYFNHAYERNAYFVEASTKIYKQIEKNPLILDDFNTFLAFMKLGGPGHAFKNLTEKNKKKFISRSYMLFDVLKNKNK